MIHFMDSVTGWFGSLFLYALPGLLLLAYFLPTFNALHHRQRTAIIVLNVLAGWTVVGWLVALIWALNNDNVSRVQRAADRR